MLVLGSLPWEQDKARADAAWTPKNLSGLTLWLRADMGITPNGAGVAAWADQSGAGNHVTQGTAGKQPLHSNTTTNGREAILFDGELGGNDGLATTTPVTVGHLFVVAYASTSAFAQYGGLVIGAPEGTAEQTFFMGNQGNGNWYAPKPTGAQRYRDGTADNVLAGVLSQHIYEITDSSPVEQTTLVIGDDAGPYATGSWPGWIAEIINYTAVQSAANTSRIRAYLAARYSITGVTL